MQPPIENANSETDRDSDESDGMNDGLVHHLPMRLLNSTCDSSLIGIENKQKPQCRKPQNKKSRKSAARIWKKDTLWQRTLKISGTIAIQEE